nr:MAG TPA: hypothetical protein [Caudoviricetes sp.]
MFSLKQYTSASSRVLKRFFSERLRTGILYLFSSKACTLYLILSDPSL